MEVKGKNAGDSQPVRHRAVRALREHRTPERIEGQTAHSDAASSATDRIDLSDSTSNAVEAHRAHEEQRGTLIAALRAELQEKGTLNSPERVAQAAARILGE